MRSAIFVVPTNKTPLGSVHTLPSDEHYMQRCIELAQRSMGYTYPNPMVGSLIVYNHQIIGEGWHQQYGHTHAEVNAVANVAPEHIAHIPHSTLYVTLEPCFHYGNTPPCVDLVLRHQFRRVVVSCTDINPLVAGKSIAKMRNAGIQVTEGVLASEGRWLARRFFTNMQQQRPYIVLKYAQSADGLVGHPEKPVWLTNAVSKRLVHKWRSEEHAILIGTRTALTDNPQLTNRLWGTDTRQPTRIVLDRTHRLPAHLHLFDGTVRTIVVSETAPQTPKPHVTYLYVPFDATFVQRLLSELHALQIASVLVEGGATTLQTFYDSNLWDEARIFTTHTNLVHGVAAPKIPIGAHHYTQQLIGHTDRLATMLHPEVYKTYFK